MLRKLLVSLCVCMGVYVATLPTARADSLPLDQMFADAGVTGTLVIESLATQRRLVHNAERAAQAFTPASTFKILNTLIALDAGAIGGADAVIRWDGTRYEIADWNRDQTLGSAFAVSCVWCYQQLAQRVGVDRYPEYLRRAGYGHWQAPPSGLRFWLDGTLTISADEQVGFLRRMLDHRLAFSRRDIETLQAIMFVESMPTYRLYAKTGWATDRTPGIGWYVGYVVLRDDTWLFALNIDMRGSGDLPLRKQMVLGGLRAAGILPAP